MHGAVLDGAKLLVDFERSRIMEGVLGDVVLLVSTLNCFALFMIIWAAGWKPRRLGGGLGGRKESGQLRFGGRDRPFHIPANAVRDAER
jgi:hypothetical protein